MADEQKTDLERPKQLGIHYQRSRHYRTVHVDGAQVGVTPRLQVQFTLFSDQKPMPEFVLHEIGQDGNLGKQIEEVVKEGFIREVEINVVMDVTTASSLVNVLQTTLKNIETLKKLQENPAGGPEEGQVGGPNGD